MATFVAHSNIAFILVKANGTFLGTGFLLTESLGLTSYNVVKNYTSNDIIIRLYYPPEMAGDFSARVKLFDPELNFAFLQVTIPEGPEGLLQNVAPPPQNGKVFIVSNPQHYCICINCLGTKDINCIDSNYIAHRFQKCNSDFNPGKLCPHDGAPVFSENGKLVAMHTLAYSKCSLGVDLISEKQYACPIVDIIIIGALKMDDLFDKFMHLENENRDLQNYVNSTSHAAVIQRYFARYRKEVQRRLNCKSGEIYDPFRYEQAAIGTNVVDYKQNMVIKNYRDLTKPWTFLFSLHLEISVQDEEALSEVIRSYSHFVLNDSNAIHLNLSPSSYLHKIPKNPPPETTETSIQTSSPGCFKCPDKNCTACEYMKEGAKFYSYRTGETYDIFHSINCSSTHVIYLVSCTKCQLQYVGMTTRPLKIRISEHFSKSDSAIFQHFFTTHKQNIESLPLCLQGIRIVTRFEEDACITEKHLMENREAYWIWKLKTLCPYGLNLRSDFNLKQVIHDT